MKVIKRNDNLNLILFENDGKFNVLNTLVGIPCEFETLEKAEEVFDKVVSNFVESAKQGF